MDFSSQDLLKEVYKSTKGTYGILFSFVTNTIFLIPEVKEWNETFITK